MGNSTNSANATNLTKVVTGKVRFSYAHVWEPKSINGGEEKYSVSLIIPKSDTKTLADILLAIEQAKKDGAARLEDQAEVNIKNMKLPLRDGDLERGDDEAYQGSYFVNANSKGRPGIVDKHVKVILDQSEFYSGCYGRASVTFYAFNQNGNKGIACRLENLQKLAEGDEHSKTVKRRVIYARYTCICPCKDFLPTCPHTEILSPCLSTNGMIPAHLS